MSDTNTLLDAKRAVLNKGKIGIVGSGEWGVGSAA